MVNARRRRQTRSLRPHSRDPIAHNEAVRLRKRMLRMARQVRVAERSIRALSAALAGFIAAKPNYQPVGIVHRGEYRFPAHLAERFNARVVGDFSIDGKDTA